MIAALYTRRTGAELYEPGTLIHPTDPIRIATPDRLVRGERKAVQIKKARSRGAWGPEGTDEVPENILAQVQWEMSVADVDVTDVPVLFWGSHLSIYTVNRDDELIGGLVEIAHKWWRDHVVANRPPEPDGAERTRETLTKMFRASRRMLNPELAASDLLVLALQYDEARAKESEAAKRKDELGNAIRLRVGEADGIAFGDEVKVMWTPDARGKTSWKAVADALSPPPELVAQHTNPPGRTLRVTVKKETRP